MTIATLKLNEPAKLQFGVSVTGATGEVETRFVIENAPYSISYVCNKTNDGVNVELKNLQKILEAGEYNVHLEVLIENKIYVPFKDTIKFDPVIEVKTQDKPKVQLEESTITINDIVVNRFDEEKLQVLKTLTKLLNTELIYKDNKLQESETINTALETTNTKPQEKQLKLINEVLSIAESLGITYKKQLLNKLSNEKKSVAEADDFDFFNSVVDSIKDVDDVLQAYMPNEFGIVDSRTKQLIANNVNEVTLDNNNNKNLKLVLKKQSSGNELQRRAELLATSHLLDEQKEKGLYTSYNVTKLSALLLPVITKIEQSRLIHEGFTK